MDDQPETTSATDIKEQCLSLKLKAAIYRASLLIGLIQPADVIAWADSILAAQEQPLLAIIEVSMAGRQELVDLAALLEEVPGECESNAVYHHMLSILNRELHSGRYTTGEIVQMLYELTIVLVIDRPDNIFDFKTDWSLAEDGLMHDINVLTEELEEWLSQFEDPDNPGPFMPLATREPYRPAPAVSYKLRTRFILLTAFPLGVLTGAASFTGDMTQAIGLVFILACLAILQIVDLKAPAPRVAGIQSHISGCGRFLLLLALFTLLFLAGHFGFRELLKDTY